MTIILTIIKVIMIQKVITVILGVMIIKQFVMVTVIKVMTEVRLYSFKHF